jgi:acyl carrier protein
MDVSDARIETDLLAIVARVSRRPVGVTLQSDLVRDLGFDSLLRLELIAELEDHFDIVIPLNATESITALTAVRDHLKRLIAAQARVR